MKHPRTSANTTHEELALYLFLTNWEDWSTAEYNIWSQGDFVLRNKITTNHYRLTTVATNDLHSYSQQFATPGLCLDYLRNLDCNPEDTLTKR